MKQTLKIIAASALVTGVLLKAAPLLAEPALQNVSMVQTTDLDLATVAGAQRRSITVSSWRLMTCAGTASDSDLSGQEQGARLPRRHPCEGAL